jgi:hypothetical protein
LNFDPKAVVGVLESGRATQRVGNELIELGLGRVDSRRKRPSEATKKPRVGSEHLFVDRHRLTRVGQRAAEDRSSALS